MPDFPRSYNPYAKGPSLGPGALRSPIQPPRADTRGMANSIIQPDRDTQYAHMRDGSTPPDIIGDVNVSDNVYSPLQPVSPPLWGNWPREWDYPSGYNINFLPERFAFFEMLRSMVQSWGLLGAVIETRKDQLMRIPWAIQLKDKPDSDNPRVDMLNDFFRKPDKKNDWDTWCRLLLDDLLVIDGATLHTGWRDKGGRPYAISVLDGATIKPLIDDAGRRPDAPSPAYQQIIKGLPETNYDEFQLIYAPMRPRTWQPVYGNPPTEQILVEIVQGIRRTIYQAQFWNEGSMPELIMTVPQGWSPQQIAQFQVTFDAMLGGNLARKSKVKFVPDGMKPFDIKNANGEGLKADIDEWLARICCYAYSVPAQPFIRQMNRATAENAKQEAEEEGLFPLMQWFKSRIMDPLIQDPDLGFGFKDIEFDWRPEGETDPAVQATVISTYVKDGIMKINEGRKQLGLPDDPAGDELIVISATGPSPLKEQLEANRQSALIQPQKDKVTLQNMKNPPQPVAGSPGKANAKATAKPPAKGVGKVVTGPFREKGYPTRFYSASSTANEEGACACGVCVAIRVLASGARVTHTSQGVLVATDEGQ